MFTGARRRAQAIGLWSTGSGLGMAADPVADGLIAAHLGWRWVFGLNVPLVLVLLVLAARVVPRMPAVPVRHRADWLGAVLITVCVAALAFGLIEGNSLGWSSPPVLSAFGAGAAAAIAFVIRERRAVAPLVDVTLFRQPAFAVANVAALIVFFAFVGALVFLSAYFQQARGESPVRAGLSVAVIGVAFAVTAPLSGRVSGRTGRFPLDIAGPGGIVGTCEVSGGGLMIPAG